MSHEGYLIFAVYQVKKSSTLICLSFKSLF